MNHIQAKTLVDSLPNMTPELSLLTRGVAWLETNYGMGWKGSARGSNNMGAITGAYKGDYFEHEDSRYDDGKVVKYMTKFRRYPSPREGFTDLARLLQTRYASAVSAVPDWYQVSRNLYGYYLGIQPKEQAIATHGKRLSGVVADIRAKTGEGSPSSYSGAGWGPGAVIGTLGALSLWWFIKRKRKVQLG